jgi:hypothetical protein
VAGLQGRSDIRSGQVENVPPDSLARRSSAGGDLLPDRHDNHLGARSPKRRRGLDRIENELGAIEDRHGEASKRYQALERKWEAVNRKLAIKAYEEFGEPEMARLLAEDEPKFDSLIAAGRDYFHRVYNPEWATEATDCRAEARRRASRGEV